MMLAYKLLPKIFLSTIHQPDGALQLLNVQGLEGNNGF